MHTLQWTGVPPLIKVLTNMYKLTALLGVESPFFARLWGCRAVTEGSPQQ